jgi:DNA-binding transcriptional LysR family regulator
MAATQRGFSQNLLAKKQHSERRDSAAERALISARSQDEAAVRWDDVRLLLALLREKSLARAGARLGLDTSTMSRRLSAFEATLHARLFERTRQGLIPTHLAQQLLPAAEAMEAAHARLFRDASAIETRAEGVVRISVPPGMADTFIAPALARLRAQHPAVRVELDASIRVLDLSRYETDLALRSIPPQGADLIITKLLRARSVVAASAPFAKQLGKVKDWSTLPWIAWDADLAQFAPSLWLKRYASGAEVVLRTSHFVAQLVAAAQGLGVLLVPEPYLPMYGLVPVKYARTLEASAQRWPVDDLWLVSHRALREVPRVAAVWDFLAAEFRGHAGSANP